MATIDKQVAASTDDCLVVWTGAAWSLNLTHIYAGAGYGAATSYKQGCGMRFTGVTIPAGATITAAYLTFTAAVDRSNTVVNSIISAEQSNAAAAFSDYANYSGRAKCAATVNWNGITAWTTDTEYNSPSLVSIIQELVDDYSGLSSADIALFWDDHADNSTHANLTNRMSRSYDNDSAKAPKLHIEYTPLAVGFSKGFIIG